MTIDAWLPIGFTVPNGESVRLAHFEGVDWQIYQVQSGGWVLIAQSSLVERWLSTDLLELGVLQEFTRGSQNYFALTSELGYTLAPISACDTPSTKSEAMAFVEALRATRGKDRTSPLNDAIYAERVSRLLPTYSLTPPLGDDVVFGSWLTGGVPVSVHSFRRLRTLVGSMGASHLADVVSRAGFRIDDAAFSARVHPQSEGIHIKDSDDAKTFTLPGRPELERFMTEHVIDIIQNADRYKSLGIDFPSAIVLHGPPGCGKTFAVERLVDFLGWPSFQIDASSVASPYIHETSRKVAEVFDMAIKNSPAIVVIDEMEAFLADRQMGAGSSHHRVEEVAEFLRRIPEAIKNQVLIVAMTNRLELIDPAILRRGRFDHVVKVDMASVAEVRSLLQNLVAELPHTKDVDVGLVSERLAGRPLSDVAFVVREGARLAARKGKDQLDQESLMQALDDAPARGESDVPTHRKIGFV